MLKLPSVTAKTLLTVLVKFGFQVDHKTGSHFILYNTVKKKRAVVPFHTKDLPKGTLMSILTEAGISRTDFITAFKS